MKKIILFYLVLLAFTSCNPKQASDSETDKNKQAATSEGTSPETGQQDDNNGYLITRNTSPGSPSMMTQEDNERVKTAYNTAVQYYQQGKLKEAAEQFETVLMFYPENPRALYYMGKIYYDLQDYDLSLEYYEKALGNNINDSLSTLAIGMIYYQEKNLEKAMEFYNMAVEGFPNYGLAYYNRGTLYGQMNKYELSLADLNKSIELDKTNPNAYLNRGLAFYYLKQMDNACKDWHKAADMGLAEGKKAVDIYCKN